jgi:sugar/nucleoside kinase (ribokinase family)
MSERQIMKRHEIEELVVTAGSRGGRILSATGCEITYSSSAHRATREIDPTGAGDAFVFVVPGITV